MDWQIVDSDWRPALPMGKDIPRSRPNLARLRILMLDDTVLSLNYLVHF